MPMIAIFGAEILAAEAAAAPVVEEAPVAEDNKEEEA